MSIYGVKGYCKEFTDNKLNVVQRGEIVFETAENIMGKEENATSIFSFSHIVFNSVRDRFFFHLNNLQAKISSFSKEISQKQF